MLKAMKVISLLVFVVGFGLFGVESHAQTQKNAPAPASASTGLRIAILDLGSIRRQSLVVKNISDQITVYRNQFRANIKKEDTALKTAKQELTKQRNVLSPEAYAQKRRQFEQKVGAVQRMIQQSKQALDQAFI